MDILEEAKGLEASGRQVISFSLGEPDFPPPKPVTEACIRALRENRTKYTETQGALPLREAISAHYHRTYGVGVDPERIIVTQGTSPAFFLVFSTLLQLGDEVILPNPHYPCDANFVDFFDGKPFFFPIHERDGYQWNLREVAKKISRKTKGILVTSPSNPTGTVLNGATLKALAGMGKTIISDEIYHGLVYEGRPHSLLEFTDEAFVINGFSKSFAMTGFRLGYLIAPKKFIRTLQKIHQNFAISANPFVQEAGIAALNDSASYVEAMRREFRIRRDVMIAGLKKIDLTVSYVPEGAFYVFVDVSKISRRSYDLSREILQKTGVAVTPGIDFGSRGEGHLRFSYAVSVEKIHEGLKRLGDYFSRRRKG